jgi:hypothetical protein
MRSLFAMLVIAVVAGLGVSWARNHADSVIHRVIDTSLPGKVEGTWAPVSHGRVVRRARVQFARGEVTSARCHATLGTYRVHIDHHFFFPKAAGRVRPGCPDRRLRTELARATRVDVGSDGTLVFSDGGAHPVTTLERPES